MSALVRTEIGPFHLPAALSGDNITPQTIDRALLPPTLALESMPQVQRDARDIALLRSGQQVKRESGEGSGDSEIAIHDPAGRLVAIAVAAGADHWQPRLVFG